MTTLELIQDELTELSIIKRQRGLTKWEMEIEDDLNRRLKEIESTQDSTNLDSISFDNRR